MIPLVLDVAAILLAAGGVTVMLVRPHDPNGALCVAGSNALMVVSDTLTGETALACVAAGCAAASLWIWIHRGGGKGGRRRLREALRRFKAVRRSAPVTESG